jgi:D-alanyl-D-alanine carboxypeptidase
MSKKTAELGMSETVFKNPTGLYSGGQSITVCDALKMTAAASQYKDIRHTWGEKRYTLKVSGPNARTLNIKSSFFIEPSLPTSSYEFLGGKTGTIPKKNKNGYLKNFLCVAKPVNGDGTVMAAVVFDVTNSSRYTSMEQLLDLACAGEADGTSVEASACGAAMIGCGETAHTGRIMAAKNIDAKFQPASLAKTMTMMVMLDCVRNLDAPLTVAPDDIVPGDGPALYAGDVFTFRDALFLAFLSSSNIAAQAVARAVGEMISQFGVI